MANSLLEVIRRTSVVRRRLPVPWLLGWDALRSRVVRGPVQRSYVTAAHAQVTIANRSDARRRLARIWRNDGYRTHWLTEPVGPRCVVVDLGAKSGCFAVALASTHPSARIDAYEACADDVHRLRVNIERNGFGPRVHARHLRIRPDGRGLVVAADPRQGPASVPIAEALNVAGRPAQIVHIDVESDVAEALCSGDPADWAQVRRVVIESDPGRASVVDSLVAFLYDAGLGEVRREDRRGRGPIAWLSRDDVS